MFNQLKHMHDALKMAKIGMKKNCIPIGCVITYKNEVIAKSHNAEFWHAEILCIQNAQKKLGKFLPGCQIFVTVKPCAMCMHAIKLARISTVIYGADNQNEPLPEVEIIDGICEDEAKNLMQEFFKEKRSLI